MTVSPALTGIHHTLHVALLLHWNLLQRTQHTHWETLRPSVSTLYTSVGNHCEFMEFKLGKNVAVGAHAYACTIIGALPNLKYLLPPLDMPALGKTWWKTSWSDFLRVLCFRAHSNFDILIDLVIKVKSQVYQKPQSYPACMVADKLERQQTNWRDSGYERFTFGIED